MTHKPRAARRGNGDAILIPKAAADGERIASVGFIRAVSLTLLSHCVVDPLPSVDSHTDRVGHHPPARERRAAENLPSLQPRLLGVLHHAVLSTAPLQHALPLLAGRAHDVDHIDARAVRCVVS